MKYEMYDAVGVLDAREFCDSLAHRAKQAEHASEIVTTSPASQAVGRVEIRSL